MLGLKYGNSMNKGELGGDSTIMPNILFTSDCHFGHKNILKYCNRPFKTSWEMDEALVTNWNSVVTENDTVYNLGDFAFGSGVRQEYVAKIAKQLKGKIHLILGNHDKLAKSIPWRFESIKHYDEINVEGQEIVLFHYGMRTWHHDLRGVWHLYGHSHGGLPPYGKSLDIGVDSWNYTPVSFTDLKAKMDQMSVVQSILSLKILHLQERSNGKVQ
jgi:calcineurin-like phosphoesterase family protein